MRLPSALITTVLLLALVTPLTTACSSAGPPGRGIDAWFDEEWTLERTESHPALADGAELAIWSRGTGSSKVRSVVIRKDGLDYSAPTMVDLFRYARPIDSGRAAAAYSDLAHRVIPDETGLTGEPLSPRGAGSDGFGDSGTYTYEDAYAWGIDPDAPVTRHAGGYELTQIVYLPPAQHPEITSKVAPARVVARTLVVYPDGVLESVRIRTLTNGHDAARYATY